MLNLAVEESGCLVEFYAAPMIRLCKRKFFRVEIVPTRFPKHIVGKVAEDVLY